jgi:copper chaperone
VGFKTNLKCNGCKATITPFLNEAEGIKKWELDLEHPDRILTLHTNGITAADIQDILSRACYTAEEINT